MKSLRLGLLAVVFSMSLVGCAGMQPVPDAEKTVESVIEVPNFTKEQIFNGSKVWIAENFKSAKAVIEYDNKEEGTIIGNSSIAYPCGGVECLSTEVPNWKLLFTMRVDAKDGKFRTTFSNLTIYKPKTQYAIMTGETDMIMAAAMPPIKLKFAALTESLKTSLGKNSTKSNW